MSVLGPWTIWKRALDDDGRHDAYIVGPDAGDWAGDGVEVVPASQLEGAVDALRPFAVPDSEFEGDDDVQVLVGVTRTEAAAIRAIVGGQ